MVLASPLAMTKALIAPLWQKVLEILEGSIGDLQMPPKPFSPSSRHISGREIESDSSTELLMSESVKEWSFGDI